MRGLLLQYNKVHNGSLARLESQLKSKHDVVYGSLDNLGDAIDRLPQKTIEEYLSSFLPLDWAIIGDVFWDTGQHICNSCKKMGVTLFFLQHGQWIYIQNKKQLKHYPAHTLTFGDDVANMCASWPYGQHSKISAVGNPRYDNV